MGVLRTHLNMLGTLTFVLPRRGGGNNFGQGVKEFRN
jgi:hypothetical protein